MARRSSVCFKSINNSIYVFLGAFPLERAIEPKIAVLKRFYLRLGDKEIDLGRDVRVVKDFQRHKVHLVNSSATVTLVKFPNGEGVEKEKIPVTPRFVYTWFLVSRGIKRFNPPCGKCCLLMPFRDYQLCSECKLVDGAFAVETRGCGEVKLVKKKRVMTEVKKWTLRQPFIVRAYSKQLSLEGEPVPDLPRFIDRLLN